MDWNCSRGFLGDAELNKVFRFEEKTTTVVRVVPGTRTPLVSTLGGQKEWDDWFSTDYPRIDGSSSGLVLILARRTGELEYPGVKKVTSNDWLQTIRLSRNKERDALQGGEISNSPASNANTNGQRGLRTLPFSQGLFKKLIKKFYVPRSISRAISRADVPTISVAKIDMGNDDEPSFPAFVYNCRTSNAWGNDLALTATYFPHCNMTFAILFGCPISVEEQMLTRLNLATSEAIHPLLIPGIFTELERVRHIEVVETTVDELETRILELDPKSMGDEVMSAADKAERDQAKRNAWLDTTYLRNQLISWNTHLEKLRHHVEDLNQTVFSPPSQMKVHTSDVTESIKTSSPDPEDRVPRSSGHEEMSQFDEKSALDASSETSTAEDCQQHEPPMEILNTESVGMMRQIGNKIQDRVQDIIGEYEEMIRDCTMRVDGMSMATQWVRKSASKLRKRD
ncbi:hypothetical protein AK830_g9517 [Neonectria ditissima]|uniref:Uncharacterized protein n=1 Tax=Neonectria ditissima TaxID=78410 RepID=A0A0P7B5J8_9HYPO|nr:hypothetical protein AK830_g9517 [Neonectria ditissima]